MGAESPKAGNNGIYSKAHNTELNFFEHLQANPPQGQRFNHHMGGYSLGRPSWHEFYPVEKNLIEGFNKTEDNAALIVDIGGSVGHDLDEFRRKFPNAGGRLVLQDLPVVIGQIGELDAKIERMPYDFFEEQPVKGT